MAAIFEHNDRRWLEKDVPHGGGIFSAMRHHMISDVQVLSTISLL